MHMPATHAVVRSLCLAGRVQMTQKGQVLENPAAVKGPFRVRIAQAEVAAAGRGGGMSKYVAAKKK